MRTNTLALLDGVSAGEGAASLRHRTSADARTNKGKLGLVRRMFNKLKNYVQHTVHEARLSIADCLPLLGIRASSCSVPEKAATTFSVCLSSVAVSSSSATCAPWNGTAAGETATPSFSVAYIFPTSSKKAANSFEDLFTANDARQSPSPAHDDIKTKGEMREEDFVRKITVQCLYTGLA
jgi:hypothetical protein